MTRLAIVFIASVSAASAQTPKPSAQYEITIRNKPGSIELNCTKGCAWTKLEFNARQDAAPVGVDYWGMKDRSDATNSPFALTVAHTAKTLKFTSSKGSAWGKLEIGCPIRGCETHINQTGTSSRRK